MERVWIHSISTSMMICSLDRKMYMRIQNIVLLSNTYLVLPDLRYLTAAAVRANFPFCLLTQGTRLLGSILHPSILKLLNKMSLDLVRLSVLLRSLQSKTLYLRSCLIV